jgi:hypothetical protein
MYPRYSTATAGAKAKGWSSFSRSFRGERRLLLATAPGLSATIWSRLSIHAIGCLLTVGNAGGWLHPLVLAPAATACFQVCRVCD